MNDRLDGWLAPIRLVRVPKTLEALVPAHLEILEVWAIAASFDRLSDALRGRTPPYPWCYGFPTKADCLEAGYCRRNPGCGD